MAHKSRVLVLGMLAFHGALAAPAHAQTQATNTASVTLPAGIVDPDTTNNTSSVTVGVVAPRLALEKTASGTDFTVGVAASYTLRVENTGTTATTAAATVTDDVPAGLTLGALPAGCTAAGQTVTCTIPAGLANGASASFVIPVTPTAPATAPGLTNTATVSGGGDPTCPAATARCTSTVVTPVAPTLDAVDDNYAVPATGGTTASVVVNDTTNGVAVVIGTNVTLAPGAAPSPATGSIVMNADGTITVAANTSAGSYDYPYTLCTVPATTPTPTCDTAIATVVVAAAAGLELVKTANPTSVTAVGDVITYSFAVRNTGNMTLTNVVVTDPMLAGLNCPALASLAPSATATTLACTGNTYTVTQADIDTNGGGDGDIDNTATADSDQGTPTTSTAVVTLPAAAPSQTLVKSLTGDSTGGAVAVGDVLTYTITLTNTGNTTLADVVVSDALITPASIACASVAPGVTCQLVGTYTVTQADADVGNIRNTAVVTSPACPAGSTDPACTTTIETPVPQVPGQSLVKALTGNADGDASGTVSVGDVLTYTITLTNTGNTTLADVVVGDALITPASIACASVAPGVTCQLVGTYTVTQADADVGNIRNTAVVTSPACPAGSTDPACTTTIETPVPQVPGQSLVKALTGNADGDASGTVSVGDVLTYTITLTNTGNTTLADVVVGDALITPASIACASVAPGATCQLVGTYTVTQTDADAGNIRNTAVVTSPACPVGSADPACTTTIDTPVPQTPGQTLVKALTGNADGDTSGTVSVGDVLTYTITLTNTGNTTLADVVVGDAMITPASIACASVAPGATCQLMGTYTVTQTDADAGNIRNTAVVTSPACPVSSTDPACTTTIDTPVPQTPSQALVKVLTANADGDASGTVSVGDVLTYTITLTNTGNTTLADVVVSDALITPGSQSCPTVAPGATCQLVGTYSVLQSDADAGNVRNTAVVTSPACPAGSTDPACTTTIDTPVPQSPSQSLVKTLTANADGDASGTVSVGDVLTYTITLTNTGNTTLADVVVGDALIMPSSQSCPTVAPGATCQLVGTYTVTQADADAGNIRNTAVVTSPACPVGSTDPTCTTTIDTPVPQTPSQTLVKALTGNADGDASGTVSVGDVLTYTITLTNTGNTTLADVVVSDALITPSSQSCPTVAPGATCQLVGTYTVLQADVDAGNIRNTAVVTSPACPAGSTDPACTTTIDTPVPQSPSQGLVKTLTGNADGDASGTVSVGDVLTYTITLTNTGNTTLADVVVSDALIMPGSQSCPTVAPGATCQLVGTYTVTQADADAGNIRNTAVVTSPVCPVSSTDPACTTTIDTPVPQTPSQSLVKVLTNDSTGGDVAVGDVLTYTITLTNTGNTTLADVVVGDALITPSSVACASVAPGATCQLVGTYTVTQTDADAGNIRNTAVVTSPACPVGSADPACTTTIDTPVPQTPGQTLVKALTGNADGDASGTVSVGDVLTYTITLTNTGNTTLADVVVGDALITPSSVACASVAPGAACQLVGTYTVTQADADTGNIRNTAVVTSPTCPAGSTDPVCTTTIDTPVDNPVVTYAKSVTLPAGRTEVSVGDTLTYTLQVDVADAATTAVLTLTDTLGTGLTLGTVSAGNFACGTGNPLVCTLPAATVPGTYVVTYTATVNDLATGFVRNAVVGTGDDAPTCQGTCQTETIVTAPMPAIVTYGKSAVLPAGKTEVAAGDTIAYTLTTTVQAAATSSEIVLTDTPGTGLTFGAVTDAGAYTCNAASPLVCTLPIGTAPGVYTLTYTATVNGQARGAVRNAVVGTGTDNPVCASDCDVETPVAAAVVVVNKSSDPASGATVQPGQTITYVLSVQIGQAAIGAAVTLTDTPDRGLTLGATPAGCAYDGTTLTCTVPAGTPVGTHVFTYTATVNATATGRVANVVVASSADPTDPPPTCQTCSTEHVVDQPEIRLGKSAGSRDVRVGDLVRYTLTVENVGTTDLVDGSIVDTPAAGFSYVEGSLVANDADGMATVSGNRPLRFDGVDVRAGETATLVYVMRVGAGVRPGTHVNQAQVRSGTDDPVSNVATAEVVLTADPLLDDSLLFGTVFNDRDGDGWQDSAALSGVKVQGGFAAGAYVANSTTVDRGTGPQPEPDASSPLLHGIAVGAIGARQSVADPVEDHTVVIRQRLSEPSFTDDFVLTSDQGVTVRMDAAGNTTVEKTGEAARGLTAAAPTVERRVAQGEGGYVVDYVIRNTGIDERGIPGVRIASVEGLLIETDQYGRYHLAGVPGGAWERGRNFILKVDPSTLPAGAAFTTDNPLLRRITPGVPVRFDFGVKLPEQVIEGGSEQVELQMGEVFFAPGSAEVRAQYRPVIEAMAARVREYRGGEVVIDANGDSEGLAFDRAMAVKDALLAQLDAASARGLVVSARGHVDDPNSLVVGVDEGGALLGTVLFDTDKSAIRPEFEALLDKVAAALERMGGGSIAIVGHTDVRASHAYNTALGMRRARAVYEALAKRLAPEVRARVRVEASNDPTAPVGVRK